MEDVVSRFIDDCIECRFSYNGVVRAAKKEIFKLDTISYHVANHGVEFENMHSDIMFVNILETMNRYYGDVFPQSYAVLIPKLLGPIAVNICTRKFNNEILFHEFINIFIDRQDFPYIVNLAKFLIRNNAIINDIPAHINEELYTLEEREIIQSCVNLLRGVN